MISLTKALRSFFQPRLCLRTCGTKHEVIELKWIQMLWDLDSESKLNRDPRFLQGMMAYGEEQAESFLNKWA
jgi:hypothetical protein